MSAGGAHRPWRDVGGRYRMTPAPPRHVALARVTELVETLLAGHALDGATGDVLDHLIDTWLAQWQAQLTPEADARRAELRHHIEDAENALARARARAGATQQAEDGARATYDVARGPVTSPVPLARETTNGDHAYAPR